MKNYLSNLASMLQGIAGVISDGEALDDTTVHGVVTHFLNRVDNQRPDPIPVM